MKNWKKKKKERSFINPSSLKGGCNNPPPTVFALVFKNTQQRGKLFQVSLSSSFLFILAKKNRKLGGGGAIPWFYNLVTLWIFEVICSQNFVHKLELSFSNLAKKKKKKKKWKLYVFLIFHVKINFCLYFTHKMPISQFSTQCSLYDVIREKCSGELRLNI